MNQELETFLRSYCLDWQGEWEHFLPWAEYTQKSLHHCSTGLTPFQCVLGFQPARPRLGQTTALVVYEWFWGAEVWNNADVRL
jgi:hypothetical protein